MSTDTEQLREGKAMEQEPIMDEELDLSRGQTLKMIWVNAYRLSRHYGGAEEGGWWYDWTDCIASMPVLNGTKTTQAKCDLLIDWVTEAMGWEPTKYERNHGGSRFTVNGHGDFVVYVEDRRAESQSIERPHYE